MKVPVFVTHRKDIGYRLCCLFLPQIDAVAPRYEVALNKLRQAVIEYFRGTRLDRSTLDERLWLTFAPELRFELVSLGFDSGRRWIASTPSAVSPSVSGTHSARAPGSVSVP